MANRTRIVVTASCRQQQQGAPHLTLPGSYPTAGCCCYYGWRWQWARFRTPLPIGRATASNQFCILLFPFPFLLFLRLLINKAIAVGLTIFNYKNFATGAGRSNFATVKRHLWVRSSVRSRQKSRNSGGRVYLM